MLSDMTMQAASWQVQLYWQPSSNYRASSRLSINPICLTERCSFWFVCSARALCVPFVCEVETRPFAGACLDYLLDGNVGM